MIFWRKMIAFIMVRMNKSKIWSPLQFKQTEHKYDALPTEQRGVHAMVGKFTLCISHKTQCLFKNKHALYILSQGMNKSKIWSHLQIKQTDYRRSNVFLRFHLYYQTFWDVDRIRSCAVETPIYPPENHFV
jgi:hypothetical protein